MATIPNAAELAAACANADDALPCVFDCESAAYDRRKFGGG
jgi:hypothetical protein